MSLFGVGSLDSFVNREWECKIKRVLMPPVCRRKLPPSTGLLARYGDTILMTLPFFLVAEALRTEERHRRWISRKRGSKLF